MMARIHRPPAITRRHLVLRDPLLQVLIRKDRWINTASGRRWLESLPASAQKRIVNSQSLKETLAAMFGVDASTVSTRPVWRSSKHGDVYTIDAVAALLGRSHKTVYNYLSAHRRLFSPPRYRRDRGHPRRLRVLTDRDVDQLIELTGQSPRLDRRDILLLQDAWRRRKPRVPTKRRVPLKGF
jgi:hypothetical protein